MTYPTFDPARRIAIIGAGVMGTKVAWASARAGIPTALYDSEPGKPAASCALALTWSEGAERERLAANLVPAETLDSALDGAQLAFENVPEDLALKRKVLGEVGRRLAPGAMMGSNASSLTCTPLAEASGRPARFFNMNFSDPRNGRLVEIMLSPESDPRAADFARAWARAIAMVPLHCRKEQMGYSFNRLWRAIKKEVLRQIAEGYATAEDIDRAWMLIFGMPIGPCGIMDQISLSSVAKVEHQYALASGDPHDEAPPFLHRMIAEGRNGERAGRGFYSYPDPAYRRPGWLEGEG
ncbi:MAG TPA: 3-hydroxyacyl-CoA dehydrogenase family protein [Kiloniellales bacterium]|nr:3-hydroxyacyl-CoA dehydrogenase family protein [Kiloniellales bacterium]